MNPNEQLRDDLSRKISAVDPRLQSLYTAHVGLRKHRAEVEAQALTEILWQSVQGIVPPACAKGAADKFSIFFQHSAKDVTRLASVNAGIQAIENTPDFNEAMTLIAPMVQERDRLDAQIETDRRAHMQAVADAEEAHRAAVAKALAAAESDPLVVTTKAQLAAIENPQSSAPVPLIRGKIKLPVEAPA